MWSWKQGLVATSTICDDLHINYRQKWICPSIERTKRNPCMCYLLSFHVKTSSVSILVSSLPIPSFINTFLTRSITFKTFVLTDKYNCRDTGLSWQWLKWKRCSVTCLYAAWEFLHYGPGASLTYSFDTGSYISRWKCFVFPRTYCISKLYWILLQHWSTTKLRGEWKKCIDVAKHVIFKLFFRIW